MSLGVAIATLLKVLCERLVGRTLLLDAVFDNALQVKAHVAAFAGRWNEFVCAVVLVQRNVVAACNRHAPAIVSFNAVGICTNEPLVQAIGAHHIASIIVLTEALKLAAWCAEPENNDGGY